VAKFDGLAATMPEIQTTYEGRGYHADQEFDEHCYYDSGDMLAAGNLNERWSKWHMKIIAP
jgi:hypothetical protein